MNRFPIRGSGSSLYEDGQSLASRKASPIIGSTLSPFGITFLRVCYAGGGEVIPNQLVRENLPFQSAITLPNESVELSATFQGEPGYWIKKRKNDSSMFHISEDFV